MKYLILFLLILFATACGSGEAFVIQGEKGEKGEKGEVGTPGLTCTIQQALNGAIITCPDGSNVLVTNGQNGLDGLPGQDGRNGTDGRDGTDGHDGQDAASSAFSIVEMIDPCGDDPGQFDEILLKMTNDTIIAYFEDGGKRFLSTIGPGSYRTTDRQACNFSVNNNNTVSW